MFGGVGSIESVHMVDLVEDWSRNARPLNFVSVGTLKLRPDCGFEVVTTFRREPKCLSRPPRRTARLNEVGFRPASLGYGACSAQA